MIKTRYRFKAQDLFDTLDREKEQGEDRRIEVKSDSKLVELIREFEKALMDREFGIGKYRELNDKGYLNPKRYSAEDIERFSLVMVGYQDEKGFNAKAGYFLSLLINQNENKEFVLDTRNLAIIPWYIGFRNTKNITIRGNAGDLLGYEMENGNITIEGNCDENAGNSMIGGLIEVKGNTKDFLGYQMRGGKIVVRGNVKNNLGSFMEGGNLIVNGNCGDNLGWCMQNGTITINRNAGSGIGLDMSGGEIYLNGDYKKIAEPNEETKGDIYHKGKLIFKDGRIIK
jgi:formylmethanofuran dehydrogenase subunit C